MKLSILNSTVATPLPWATGPAPVRLRTDPRPASVQTQPQSAAPRRSKLWELGAALHCSVIGTCLATGELRALLRRFNATRHEHPSDHELHSLAVAAACQRDALAKQLQKQLDQRHRQAINRFSAARDEHELRGLWQQAMQAGDIPGSYWAVLTHPLTSDALVRSAFGDVHMLSHLVGAANRADLSRLNRLEQQKAALEDELARLQASFRDAVTSRDLKIRQINELLSAQIAEHSAAAIDAGGAASPALEQLVADLRQRLDLEIRRRERAERRTEARMQVQMAMDRTRSAFELEAARLRGELETAEERLAALANHEPGSAPDELDLTGRTILYVGGRTHHIARLRSVIETAAGHFLHHDGGVEERTDLLPGLVSRADIAMFPVDCISHLAAQSLKRLCRQFARPYVPLRSSGIASMLYALRTVHLDATAAQAD